MASATSHSSHASSSAVTYLMVFAALLALTASTVLVAYAPLGHWHTTIAVGIAMAKGTLIILFFMHGLESSRLIHLILLGALLWLGIMLAFTLADFWTRHLDFVIHNPVLQ